MTSAQQERSHCTPAHINWVGTNKCHCASCCQTFSTVSNFDRHRKGGECLPPESAGMHRNKHGVWIQDGEFHDQ